MALRQRAPAVVFDTPIGRCGLSWSGRGITAVALPGDDLGAAPLADLAAVPASIVRAIRGLQALLGGAPDPLLDIELDLSRNSAFSQRVYKVARAIPPGQTLSYGDVARALGAADDPLAAREVGRALGENPVPLIVPCHRVLAAGGKTGGFSARGGVELKLRLLAIEGAAVGGTRLLF